MAAIFNRIRQAAIDALIRRLIVPWRSTRLSRLTTSRRPAFLTGSRLLKDRTFGLLESRMNAAVKLARRKLTTAAMSICGFITRSARTFFQGQREWVVGHHGEVGIRSDSTWNVPEPELSLVMNPALEVVGMTAGNDMSSRNIEGENPLYLPQAKIYSASCALDTVSC